MATWQSFDPFQALHREIENAFERAGTAVRADVS